MDYTKRTEVLATRVTAAEAALATRVAKQLNTNISAFIRHQITQDSARAKIIDTNGDDSLPGNRRIEILAVRLSDLEVRLVYDYATEFNLTTSEILHRLLVHGLSKVQPGPCTAIESDDVFYVYQIGKLPDGPCYVGQSKYPFARFQSHIKTYPDLDQTLQIMCFVDTREKALRVERMLTEALTIGGVKLYGDATREDPAPPRRVYGKPRGVYGKRDSEAATSSVVLKD